MLQGRERYLRSEIMLLLIYFFIFNIFLNFKREKDCSLISKEKDCLSEHIGKASVDDEMNSQDK